MIFLLVSYALHKYIKVRYAIKPHILILWTSILNYSFLQRAGFGAIYWDNRTGEARPYGLSPDGTEYDFTGGGGGMLTMRREK